MDVLKIENNYSYFISNNEEIKNILWKSLRFREKGYFHNRAYRAGVWDGYVDFFKKNTGRFLTGLLPEVKTVLKAKNIEFEVSDLRSGIEFLCPQVDENFLGHGFKLRDYQIEYIEKIARHKRGVISALTGSGKTLVMAGIIKNLPENTPTLILCNRKSLVEQNYSELIKFGIKNVGRVYDKYKEPNLITCSTVQSANHIEKLLPNIKTILIDEVHLLMSAKARKLYSKLNNCYIRVGMSATPFKFGGKDACQKYGVKGWIGPVIKLNESTETGVLTVDELQRRNILSTVDCTFFKVKKPFLQHEIYLDAVTKGIAQNEHFHSMVKNLSASLEGRTLILVDRIEHGDRLKSLMPYAHWIQGKDDMESRKHVIDQLSNSEHAIGIATSGIIGVGINVFINNLISCIDSNAEHVLLQTFGRGLRVKDDKKHLRYFDFIFEINDYLHKHSNNRIKILKKHGHKVTISDESFS